MQRLAFVRYTVKAEQVAANKELATAVFSELRETAPKHVGYAVFQDGADFVHLFVNFEADDSAVLTDLPSFKAYSKDVAIRCVAPLDVTRLGVNLVESYGFAKGAR